MFINIYLTQTETRQWYCSTGGFHFLLLTSYVCIIHQESIKAKTNIFFISPMF